MTAYIFRSGEFIPAETVADVTSVQQAGNLIIIFHKITNDVFGFKSYNADDNKIILKK